MFLKKFTKTQKLALSALFMAMYVVVMIYTQSFAFGQYQIRFATTIYALSAIFPFLIVPLGMANLISNTLMGGLGPLDMIGGAVVGLATCASIVLIKRQNLSNWFISLCIILIPGLCVPIWLSILLDIPYLVLMPALVIGQIIPGLAGTFLVNALEKNLAKSSVKQQSQSIA